MTDPSVVFFFFSVPPVTSTPWNIGGKSPPGSTSCAVDDDSPLLIMDFPESNTLCVLSFFGTFVAKLNSFFAARARARTKWVRTHLPVSRALLTMVVIDRIVAKHNTFNATHAFASISSEKVSFSSGLALKTVFKTALFLDDCIMRFAHLISFAAHDTCSMKLDRANLPVVALTVPSFSCLGTRKFCHGTPNNENSSLALWEISILLCIISCALLEIYNMLSPFTPRSGINSFPAHPAFYNQNHCGTLSLRNEHALATLCNVIARTFLPLSPSHPTTFCYH